MGFGLSGLSSRIRRCGSGSDCRNGLKDDDDESGVADVSSAACKEKKIHLLWVKACCVCIMKVREWVQQKCKYAEEWGRSKYYKMKIIHSSQILNQ